MKWEKPNVRLIKRFALFPIRIEKEYRWLETVYIEQFLIKGRLSDAYYWADMHFVDKADYLDYKHKKHFF